MARSASHGILENIVVFSRIFYEAMQVGPGNLQAAGGKCFVPLALLNGPVSQLDFVVLHLFFEGSSRQGVPHTEQIRVLHSVGQVLRVNGIVVAQDDRALDNVFEFTDISRPLIFKQQRHRSWSYPGHRLFANSRVLLQKMLGQLWNIFRVVPERRGLNTHHIDSVIEILAKGSFLHHLKQTSVCREQ